MTDLLCGTAVVAAVAALFVSVRTEYYEELRLVEKLKAIRSSLPYDARLMSLEREPGGSTWLRSLLGDASQGIVYSALKHLRSLRRLRLTHISPEAMDELRKSLPECEVW